MSEPPDRRRHRRRHALALAVSLLATPAATAAEPPADPLFNPKPRTDDLELPMPCDGRMVFRAVAILGKGPLDDVRVRLGQAFDADDPHWRQGFLVDQRDEYLSGPFRPEDLPAPWRTALEPTLKAMVPAEPATTATLKPFLYFIGKYEVTAHQVRLVLDQAAFLAGEAAEPPACPAVDTADAALRRPRVDLSWVDALRFTQLYSQWLARTARDRVPTVADGAPGFVRLPTEAEWEFAARGAHAVTETQLARRTFPPIGGSGGEALADYAVFAQVAGGTGKTARLMPIGSKKANPIGLHDVLGNAAEMVLDPFRPMHGGGRAAGVTGGVIVKGGNFQEGEGALFTGMRREYPFVQADGRPSQNGTTGFRVALGAIAAPAERFDAMHAAWQEAGRLSRLVDGIDRINDPAEKLEIVIKSLADDEKIQAALRDVGTELKKSVRIMAEQRRDTVAKLIQAATMNAEVIHNYGLRLSEFQDRQRKAAAADADTLDGIITNGRRAQQGALDIYLDNVALLASFPTDLVEAEHLRVKNQLGLKPVIGSSLTARADKFLRHVAEYRRAGRLNRETTLKDLVEKR